MRTTTVFSGAFDRPHDGPVWNGLRGWRSQGGGGPRHPDRALPSTFQVAAPEFQGRLVSVAFVGVFAQHGSTEVETAGARGGVVQFVAGDRVLHSQELAHGMHYSDASSTTDVYRLNGDGTSVETIGRVEIAGCSFRVDRLALDVPGGVAADRLILRDLGTPASFVVFDVAFEYEEVAECPFKGHDGQIALSEIGAILRLRDRARLDAALHQMTKGIHQCGQDTDEARGLALTFLAAVVGALLELDPQRKMHKEPLEAARELESLDDPTAIAAAALTRVRRLTDPVVRRTSRTGDELIDRALDLLARNFTAEVDADSLASQLNLSTSHFRYLFREATRQPFHRYIVSMRLEKARDLLIQTEIPVTEVASIVGFQNPAHFSRAFSKRFGIAPSALRQGRRTNDVGKPGV